MKGITTIQLFDATTGDEVLRKKDENIITNLYKNAMEYAMKGVMNGAWVSFTRRTPKEFGEAIMLLDSEQIENANNFAPKGLMVGFAHDAYAGGNTQRGSLNVSESGSITNGYKFVWDFVTSAANGTIASVALTGGYINISAGDGALKKVADNGQLDVYGAIGGDFSEYKMTGSGIQKKVCRSGVAFLGTVDEQWVTTNLTISGFDSFVNARYCALYGGYLYFVARKTSDTTMRLVKMNLSDGSVVDSWILTTGASAGMRFGFLGGALVYPKSEYQVNPHVHYVFNLSSRAYESDLSVPAANTSGGKCGYLQMGTSLAIFHAYTGYPYYSYSYSIIDENRNIIRLDEGGSVNTNYGNLDYNTGAIDGTGLYSASYVQATGGLALTVVPCSLFSINNLSSPVTKNNTQTMKVTYELTW